MCFIENILKMCEITFLGAEAIVRFSVLHHGLFYKPLRMIKERKREFPLEKDIIKPVNCFPYSFQ